MPDPSTLVNTPIAQTLQTDEVLIQQAAELVKKKDWVKLAELAWSNKGNIQEQASVIENTVIPFVKSGYKTTEFWLILGYGLFQVAIGYFHIQIPATDDVTLGGLVASYLASRHITKNQ